MFKPNYSPDQALPETIQYFKEEAITEILEIPDKKPNIETISDIMVWPNVESFKLIETEEGISNSGQKLTGYKLIVKVKLSEKVIYVANDVTQSVHAAHYETIKNLFIVLPKKINNQDVCKLARRGKLIVMPYIECVDYRKLSSRCIQKCTLLLVDVKAMS